MATYAIGDVQGCFTALCALLERLSFHPARDRLWFAGDLVNRGPQSLEVLRFIKSLGESAVVVLGNHDLHLLALGCGQAEPKRGDTLNAVLAAPDRDDLLTWLRHRPLLHHDAGLGMTMLHAGLPPQWTLARAQAAAAEIEVLLRRPDYASALRQLRQRTPAAWADTLEFWEQRRYITHCFTHLRYCDAVGRLALGVKGRPGSQPPGYVPWFAVPQRASASLDIVFGHWATLGPCTAPGVHALDTGCVWGGALTAMCLESRQRFSVPCSGPACRET
ncbi:MAG: symmetrical bis(5'-nucleosyl)-tetraphosphatase [Candidatus Tectimicrobiota bacterium]